MKKTFPICLLVSLGFGVSGRADAITYIFAGTSGSNGQALSATVDFQVSGNTLTIVMTNTAKEAASDGANVLGGLFFDIASNPVFSDGNADLSAGANLVKKGNNSNQSGNSLNSEWMFDSPVSGGITSTYGIGSTGWPSFNTNTDSFDKVFQGGSGTAGANDDYGMVPTAGITVGSPSNLYVRNSMTFTFTLSKQIDLSEISNVNVSYGSAGQTLLSPVPEPASIVALGLGAAVLIRRRKKA